MKAGPQSALPVIGALAVAAFPLFGGLPPWIAAWCVLLWGYVPAAERTGWPLPGPGARRGLFA